MTVRLAFTSTLDVPELAFCANCTVSVPAALTTTRPEIVSHPDVHPVFPDDPPEHARESWGRHQDMQRLVVKQLLRLAP